MAAIQPFMELAGTYREVWLACLAYVTINCMPNQGLRRNFLPNQAESDPGIYFTCLFSFVAYGMLASSVQSIPLSSGDALVSS